MRFILVVIMAMVMIGITGGCYYDKEELLYPGTGTISCTTVSAKFGTDIKPIMQNKCATSGCHNTASAAGGVILVTYAQVNGKAARINQRCVITKDMPPSAPLTPSEIASLKCWIDSGAPNN
jgi:uncharacterized membrane protein